jgi:hypothetical protein
MHDYSIRASHRRHQKSARTAALLVAALFLVLAATVLGPAIAHSGTSVEGEVAAIDRQAPTPQTDVAHEVAIATVSEGQEGLLLAAKLDENGGPITLPIQWKIVNATGETVYAGEVPEIDIFLAPGDYMVHIAYGAAQFQRGLTLLPGNHLAVSYVLNVGGLRILPRVQGIGLPQAPSVSKIFAASGINRGHLVAQSEMPGEIIRVPAGDYRVESRFAAGNTVAVADVKVKPGIMSAIDIDHRAGLARLSFVGAPDSDVAWNIATTSGEELAAATGLYADVVLKPGTYIAKATAGNEVMTATFAIEAGESRDIILGN